MAANNSRYRTPASSFSAGSSVVRSVRLDDVVFVNIETVPELPSFSDLTYEMRQMWESFSAPVRESSVDADEFYGQAGRYAEFGRAVCISVGVLRFREGEKEPYLITSSYHDTDEHVILARFSAMVDGFFRGHEQNRFLCGHGILHFEIPFFARRLLVNCMPLPLLFDPHGLRPLSSSVVDTSDFWAFASQEDSVSAELLGHVFGIDVESEDYDYAVSAELFHSQRDVVAIVRRSERKLLTSVQIMRRFRGERPIDEDHVVRKKA